MTAAEARADTASDGVTPPDPLREEPPADRFCDLVLNGGVASGVVYPWALVELARHYRFRNIGGNSVGAMAAAMAAAAEYGRCTGVEDAFEPLRRFPLELAEECEGRPLMFRLFQPAAAVRRLFEVFLLVVRFSEGAEHMAPAIRPKGPAWWALITLYSRSFVPGWTLALAALAVLVAACVQAPDVWKASFAWGWVGVVLLIVAAVEWLIACACAVRRDLRGFEQNDYGLCRGSSTGQDEALVEWLHRGIQCSAGRGEHDPPLTFADLWAAPRFGRAGPAPAPGGLQPPESSINLQMFSSNITQGRPVRLPLNDANTRLYYHPDEWALFFPPKVMKGLDRASSAYVPASRSDPGTERVVRLGPGGERDPRVVSVTELRELPSGAMPLVVAARLSLCYPVLFSCVPVYAVDYESRQDDRDLRRCLMSDGGLCSNFPVHLFDAASPRWPTFAFLLDKRLQPHKDEDVWLPKTHLEGRADNWLRAVPGAELPPGPETPRPQPAPTKMLKRLGGVAVGLLLTTKDWNDRFTGRLPTVRNRIVRLALQEGEGQLNIAMPGSTMLGMARRYGVGSAEKLMTQFMPAGDGTLKQGWRDQLYVRAVVELRALRAHLRGYGAGVRAGGHTVPLRELLAQVTVSHPQALLDNAAPPRPLAPPAAGLPDPAGNPLLPEQREALLRAVRAVETLEAELADCEARFGPYFPVLAPELRLRPPV